MFPPFHEELRRFLENYKAERISCGCDNASFEPDSTSKLESDAVDNYEELKADFLSLWNVVAASYINRDKKTRPGNDYLTLCGGLPPGVYHSLAGLRDSNMAENHTCKWKHLQGTAEKSDCQKKGGRRSSLAGTSDCDDRIIGTRFRPKKLDSSDFPISMPKGLCENSSESRNLGGNSSPGLARDCDKRDTSSDDVLEDRCVLGKREKVTPDMENVIKKLRIWGDSRRPADLSRSQYSLVSCAELTPDAVQLWLGLPDEVKYDPALDSFRKLYEREHGKVAQISAATRKNGRQQRLPLVSSAPHLNNNTHFTIDDVIPEGERHDVTADSKINGVLPTEPKHETPLKKAANFTKIFLLVSAWIFFTVVFMLYNEKENVVMNTSILPGAVKRYNFNATDESISIRLTLIGPFLSEQTEFKLNKTEAENALKLTIWLEENENKLKEGPWSVVLLDKDSIDFSTGETRTLLLQAKHSNSDLISLAINTTSDVAVPVRLAIKDDPLPTNTGVIYASLLLCALYLLIVFEIMNRTMAAVIVSTSSLAVLAIAGERPSVQELVSWLDVETLLLLFSMMILVAIMAETGIFDFLAVYTFEVTKGKLWPLITLLCVITAVLSTFLDNVTTVLLMTPVTIRLCEVMDLNPIPILLSMVLFSNIGGTATPVGDPPNVIIASNKAVIQAGINFTNFTLHMTAGILLVCVQTYFQLRFIYRDTNKLRLNVPREIQDARHQISIWRRAIDSLPHLSKDEHVVRERLERKCSKLSLQLQALMKDSKKRACPKDTFQSTLAELKGKYKIKNVPLLVKASVSIVFVVVVFFLHSLPELSRVSLGWTALLGALLLLILADREDLEPILHRVEWSTLLFFAALFVLMEALAKLGLIDFIGHLTEQLIVSVPSKARLAVALLLMLWVSGLASAFIDNIPLTTMMVRVVTSLGANPALPELPLPPLVWALAFAACLGGNGTLIGASANVVCAGVAEQHGYKFTFMEFFKVGFPVMIGHLVVASAYLLLCHCVFTWH